MTRALIVGAGVGGLAAAVALRAAHVEVAVLERAARPDEILLGGGLHLWPNGMRACTELGLADEVRAVGETIHRLDWHTPEHGVAASVDLAATARAVGAPSVGVRRADLLAVLLAAAGTSVRFGAELEEFEQDADGVTVRLADGRTETGDLLVGADGVRSAVRRRLAGESELRAPGVLVCQATVAREPGASAGTFAEVWGPTVRFGSYPVRDGLFWFAFLRSEEATALDELGAQSVLLERMAGWTAPAAAAVARTPPDEIGWAEVVARDPLERWTDGRVALLGDAAHAMTPFTGQGACQALEDAVVLAECVRGGGSLPAALERYGARRGQRTREIWNRSWAAAVSVARKSRALDPERRQAFASTFERVVWRQLEQTISASF